MKDLFKIIFVVIAGIISTAAFAIPSVTNQWTVTDAAGNCSGGPHGLWTNSLSVGSGSCLNYYSFQSGSVLTEYDNGTAILSATALNPGNILATIDITFGGFSTTHGVIKNGGGATAAEIADWNFYTTIVSGSIGINSITYDVAGLTDGTALQIGIGANDKSHVFGASSWLDMQTDSGPLPHWDLNMNLASVPEPSMLALMSIGLLGFGVRLFRK